jgi:hypothetical protein
MMIFRRVKSELDHGDAASILIIRGDWNAV